MQDMNLHTSDEEDKRGIVGTGLTQDMQLHTLHKQQEEGDAKQ